MQIQLCLQRGFQRLRGDMSVVLGGAIGNTILAMIISSIFYNLPSDTGSFFSRAVLLFFAILLNAFSSFMEVRYDLSLLTSRILTLEIRYYRSMHNGLLWRSIRNTPFTTHFQKP